MLVTVLPMVMRVTRGEYGVALVRLKACKVLWETLKQRLDEVDFSYEEYSLCTSRQK